LGTNEWLWDVVSGALAPWLAVAATRGVSDAAWALPTQARPGCDVSTHTGWM